MYVSKEVRIRGHFSKPKGSASQNVWETLACSIMQVSHCHGVPFISSLSWWSNIMNAELWPVKDSLYIPWLKHELY